MKIFLISLEIYNLLIELDKCTTSYMEINILTYENLLEKYYVYAIKYKVYKMYCKRQILSWKLQRGPQVCNRIN